MMKACVHGRGGGVQENPSYRLKLKAGDYSYHLFRAARSETAGPF